MSLTPEAAAVTTLAIYFSTGATDLVKDGLCGILERKGFDSRDVTEGIERIIHTHTGRFPQPAVVLGKIQEARADRIQAERANESTLQLPSGPRVRRTDDDREKIRVLRDLADLGLTWCGTTQAYGPPECGCFPGCFDRGTGSLEMAVAALKDAMARGMEPIHREPAPDGWSNAGDVAGSVA